MTHENYSSPASNEPTATNRSNLVTLEQVKIHLALQLGETEVTLGDLEHMQPGYVIEFPQTMAQFRPVLLANGQPIGRGELVNLGNRMGVRVTEWSNNGL